jgi:hypothetical protein
MKPNRIPCSGFCLKPHFDSLFHFYCGKTGRKKMQKRTHFCAITKMSAEGGEKCGLAPGWRSAAAGYWNGAAGFVFRTG